ncbi:MAG: hypothetical protein U0414_11110 [Polyangiaceae bacterium]
MLRGRASIVALVAALACVRSVARADEPDTSPGEAPRAVDAPAVDEPSAVDEAPAVDEGSAVDARQPALDPPRSLKDFIPPEPPSSPHASHRWSLPTRVVRRPIVLPLRSWALHSDLVGAPLRGDPATDADDRGASQVRAGIAYGATGFLDLGAFVKLGFEDFLGLDLDLDVRLFSDEGAQVAVELQLSSQIDWEQDEPVHLTLRPAVRTPIWFVLGNTARIETALGFAVVAPTDGESRAFLSLTGPSSDPAFATPAIPLGIVVQPWETLRLGVSSGLGVLSLETHLSASEIRDGVFAPLTFMLGYTLADDGHPVADLGLHAGFPYAFLGSTRDHFASERWAIGLDVRILLER